MQMNGNCGEPVCGKGEIGLILRGEDERITNRLAVTSLLYRFKVRKKVKQLFCSLHIIQRSDSNRLLRHTSTMREKFEDGYVDL